MNVFAGLRPTRRGIGFLILAVVLWVAGWFARLPVLAFAATVLVAAVGAGFVSVMLTRRVRDATRSIYPDRAEAGDLLTIEVATPANAAVGGVEFTDHLPPSMTGEARWRGATSTYQLRAGRRGAHLIGPLSQVRTDPFGVAMLTTRVERMTPVLILPRIRPIEDLWTGAVASVGEEFDAARRVGVGEDDIVARPYVLGDEIKRLHWKATAHRGELMVRQEEQREHPRLTVLLDNAASAHGNEPEKAGVAGTGAWSTTLSLEWCVSAAASFVHHYAREGFDVDLVALDGFAITAPAMAHGGRSDQPALLALAELEPSTDTARRSFDVGETGFVVVLTGRLDADAATRLVQQVGSAHVVAFVGPSPSTALSVLDSARWRVVTRRVAQESS